MKILDFKLNDAGDMYLFSDVCLQYETIEIKRDINYTGTASFVLVNEYEANKFSLDDVIVFLDSEKHKSLQEDKRGQFVIIDITRNKDASTNIVKTNVTAIPMINYILGNRVQLADLTLNSGVQDNVIMFYLANYVIGSQCKYNDSKLPSMTWGIYGNKDKYVTTTNEKIIIPKNKVSLENVKEYTTNYNYYCTMLDLNLYGSESDHKINAYLRICYPTDKSDSVIFSESMGNCVLTDYTLNSENEKNVCYVFASDGTVTANGAGVGMRRKEMLAEKETYNGELDAAKQITNAKITILNNGMYEYLKDYDLNTIVSFYDNNLGIQIAKPIESITEYYSTDKEEIEISIGEFVPNVFDKLKGVKK